MVAFARIQNRIYYGYQKAAIRLGVTFTIYRSADGIDPILPAKILNTRLISIDQDFTYVKARKYGDLMWQFLPYDGLTLQNYDFMVGPTTTYYILDVAPADRLSPPTCMECNAVVSITNPINTIAGGTNAYQAYSHLGGNKLYQNCPAAIIEHSRMDGANLKLPTSVKLPYYEIYVPEYDDNIIKTGFVVEDDQDRRFTVISAERTKRFGGFRIIASLLGV